MSSHVCIAWYKNKSICLGELESLCIYIKYFHILTQLFASGYVNVKQPFSISSIK